MFLADRGTSVQFSPEAMHRCRVGVMQRVIEASAVNAAEVSFSECFGTGATLYRGQTLGTKD